MLARQRRATRPQVKMIGLVINIKVKRRPSDQSYSNGWSLKIDWPPTVLTEPKLYTRPVVHSTYCTKYNNCLFPFWLPPKCFKLDFKLTRCPKPTPLPWPNPCFSAHKCTWCTQALVSVHTSNLMLRGSRDNTVLGPKLTASMLRDHYVKELHVIKVRGGALL